VALFLPFVYFILRLFILFFIYLFYSSFIPFILHLCIDLFLELDNLIKGQLVPHTPTHPHTHTPTHPHTQRCLTSTATAGPFLRSLQRLPAAE
jgi:hypothetical protein